MRLVHFLTNLRVRGTCAFSGRCHSLMEKASLGEGTSAMTCLGVVQRSCQSEYRVGSVRG